MIKSGDVLSSALCKSLSTVSCSPHSTAADGVGVVTKLMQTIFDKGLEALSYFQSALEKIQWINGGATMQPEIYRYLYLSLQLVVHFTEKLRVIHATNSSSELSAVIVSKLTEVTPLYLAVVTEIKKSEVHPKLFVLLQQLENVMECETV